MEHWKLDVGRVAALTIVLGLSAGCAGTGTGAGSLLSQRPNVGSLKTSLSHLEFENEQLRREVADLKSENREVENRLVQEETANGDLTARLDDARNALRGKGLSVDNAPESSPARKVRSKKRKPPFAQVPGRVDARPDDDPDPATIPRDDFGPQSRRDDDGRWLPVARGPLGGPSRYR